MTTKLTQLNIFLFEDGGNIKKGVIKCEVFNGLLQGVFRKTIKTHVHTSILCVLLHLLSGLHNFVCQLYDVVKKYCLLRTKQVSSYTKLGLKNKHHVLLQLSLEVYAFVCSQFLDVLYATIPRRSLVFLSGEIYCDLDRLYIIYF